MGLFKWLLQEDPIERGEGWFFEKESGKLTINGTLRGKFPFQDFSHKVQSIVTLKGAVATFGCSLFAHMDQLTSADLANLELRCRDLHYMFEGCSSLVTLDLTGWRTGGITNMCDMFSECSSLETLKVGSGWSMECVTEVSSMFRGCSNLRELDDKILAKLRSPLKYCDWMFYNCRCLEKLDLTMMNVKEVKDLSFMFEGCSALRTLNLGGWSTGSATYMSHLFSGCSSLKELDLTGWHIGKDTNTEAMFKGLPQGVRVFSLDETVVRLLPEGVKSDFSGDGWIFNPGNGRLTINGDLGRRWKPFFRIKEKVRTVVALKGARAGNGSCLFSLMKNLTSADLSELDVSACESMESMFANCELLSSVDLTAWDITNVKYMQWMFDDCKNLKSIMTGPKWDPRKAVNVEYMFLNCTSLRELNITRWGSSELTSCNSMFNKCKSLEELDLSSMDISNVTSLKSMFLGCSNLRSLKLSGWDTRNVTRMDSLFSGCKNLEVLDLTGWHIGEKTTTENMVAFVPETVRWIADDKTVVCQCPKERREQIEHFIYMGLMRFYTEDPVDAEGAGCFYERAAGYGRDELTEQERKQLCEQLIVVGTWILDVEVPEDTQLPGYSDRAAEMFNLANRIMLGEDKGETQYSIGVTFYRRSAIPDNQALAAKWFEQAANFGNKESQIIMGGTYEEGTDGFPKDWRKARDFYQKAADQGDADALFFLGVLYSKGGNGISKDTNKSTDYFQKAADLGHSEGQYNIAVGYYHGEFGLPLDRRKAAEWFRKAAEQGLPKAQYALGTMYLKGSGGLPDSRSMAREWYKKAAEQGDPDAQKALLNNF